mgnify:CR=1 FL=1
MIKYVHRKDLDLDKYNFCIENSIQTRVYAFSWYLDVVANHWDVLVLDDYEAVMPIPWNKKYGLKYVTQPYFCQQICVYSKSNININIFIKKISKYFLYVNLNSCQKPDDFESLEKINYQLNLNSDYSKIFKNYRKDRKKSLKKAKELQLRYQDFDNIESLIELYKIVFSHIKTSDKYFETIQSLMMYCLQNKIGFTRNIFVDSTLVCSGFFVNYNARIYYLFAASSALGKKYGATTFLIDSVIKEYSNSDFIFDFEGSTIPNVGSFYKSFGSKKTTYFNLKTNVFKRVIL